ncbi:DUF2470 domain-containing protein [Streptomyces decoyicus]|uniref:DUF2470 domain-containing protein n=1 Tax=Streptomyces decoyicus TaxID=249567 RepID=UPI003F4B87EC
MTGDRSGVAAPVRRPTALIRRRGLAAVPRARPTGPRTSPGHRRTAPARPVEYGPPDTQTATRVPVRLELTDIAPTPVRDRVRARVKVTGVLAAPYDAEAAKSTCMEFGQAVLEDAQGRTYVTLHALEATELDPISTSEAGMLTHLVDDHSEVVPLLLRLVRPHPDNGMLRALPVAMDRYGVTLRLEYPHTHHDVRLPFKTPVTDIDQAGPQIHALLTTARRLSHTGRLLT